MDKSITGQCNPCYTTKRNSDPEFKAIKAAGQRAKYRSDPAFARLARERLANNKRKSLEDPAALAAQIEQAHRNLALSRTPAAGQRRRQTKEALIHPWCPRERVAHYRLLMRKGCRAAEAKAMILVEIKAERERMSPFERQDAALAKQMRRAA